jgi:hypothetical protein
MISSSAKPRIVGSSRERLTIDDIFRTAANSRLLVGPEGRTGGLAAKRNAAKSRREKTSAKEPVRA